MSEIKLTQETLNAMIAQAVAAAMAGVKEAKVTAAKEGKSERSIKNEILCVKAFKKAGFAEKDIIPHKTVMTYNRWLAEGRKVKVGEHAVKVKNLRLFHISQTEAISPEEKADALARMQEAIRNHNDAKKASEEQPSA